MKSAQSVLQPWVASLPLMQQAVLLAGIRGPDGIRKDHVAKLLLRWFRRCLVISAFTGRTMATPWEDDGGSFTGPSVAPPASGADRGFVGDHHPSMTALVKEYLKTVDELPHHFQLHFMHGAEILGYKHPDLNIRSWWWSTYYALVNDMHLEMESEVRMDYRLGDREASWRECEAGVTATGPSPSGEALLQEFLRDCCKLGPKLRVPASDLRIAYQVWCERRCCQELSPSRFHERLKCLVPALRLSRYGGRLQQIKMWFGVGLARQPLPHKKVKA